MNEDRRQAAIEAGARALYGDCQPPWDELPEAMRWADRKDAAAVIDAAAPHLQADALHDAADDVAGTPGFTSFAYLLRRRAHTIERGEDR